MGRGEDLEFFICDVAYWDVLVGWELLGDERDSTYVFIVAAKAAKNYFIFGNLMFGLKIFSENA